MFRDMIFFLAIFGPITTCCIQTARVNRMEAKYNECTWEEADKHNVEIARHVARLQKEYGLHPDIWRSMKKEGKP